MCGAKITHRFAFALLIGVLLAGDAAADGGTPTDGGSVETHSLDDLAWMTGYWGSTENGVQAEECWLEPRGNLMVGVHRDVGKSGSAFFEFLTIEQTDAGIFYLASPMAREATRFALAEIGQHRVVFENPAHDFPRRIIYWLDESAALNARVEGEKKGKPAAAEWVWERRAID